MASLRFDLYQDSVWPYAPAAANYRASFTQKLTAADGVAWPGAFDSTAGDQAFNLLQFGTVGRAGLPALLVDWNTAGDGVAISSALVWNEIKNVHVDGFTGATLAVRNFVDALIDLHAGTAGQAVTVDGAKRGRIDLGSGDDTLFVGADSNSGTSGGNDFQIDTGAGADTVRITRSTIDYSITAFREGYQEKWTSSFVHLGAGNDSIVADGSNDTVWGGADNDTAELRGGSNLFDGEAGFDTIVLRGLKADYLIEDLGGSSYRLTDLKPSADGDDGSTTILNVERAVFSDQVWLIGLPGNTPPVAADDSTVGAEDTAIVVAVLGNDADADGNPLAVTAVTQGGHGTVMINLDGTLTYTPAADFNGTDQFTYTISDGQGGSGSATVNVTVTPVNDAPVAHDDFATTVEDATLPLQFPVLFNDTDPDGDPITVLSFTQGQHGTVTLGANLAYQPTDPNYNGTDSFTYTIIDAFGATATATVTVTVLPANDPMVANDDIVTIAEDSGAVVITPLANDTDIDGDTLTLLSITQAAHGLVQQNGNNVLYIPDPDFHGTDQFTYQVFDQGGVLATATVFITVTPVNDAPVGVDDTVQVAANAETAISIASLLANDSDVDGDTFGLLAYGGTPLGSVQIAPLADSFIYTPPAGFTGSDSFTYTITDAGGATATATITLTVGNTVVAVDDAFSVQTGVELAIAVSRLLANDDDPNGDSFLFTGSTGAQHGAVGFAGDTLYYLANPGYVGTDTLSYTIQDAQGAVDEATITITVLAPPGPVANADAYTVAEDSFQTDLPVLANDVLDIFTLSILAGPQHGQATVTLGGIIYQPQADFFGIDSFTYQVTDQYGQAASTTVTVTVTPLNDLPIAVPDSFSGTRDTPVAGNISLNDIDVDGDTLTYAVTGTTFGGSVVLNPDGTFVFTPAPGQSGLFGFSYTVSDGQGGENLGLVSITIAAGNDAPVANADSVTIAEDTAQAVVAVLANDVDDGATPLAVAIISGPSHGLAEVLADGSIAYAPAANFNGTDSIGYRVTDDAGLTSTSTLSIVVTAVNDAPVPTPDVYFGTEDQAFGGDLSLNDFDVDGDTLTYSAVGALPIGMNLQANGGFTYSPAPNLNGFVSFTYQVSDGHGGTAQADVLISLAAVEDAPLAGDDTASTTYQTPVEIAVLANDTNADGQALSPLTDTNPQHGTLASSPGGTYTYTPEPGFSGTDTFTYVVTNGTENSVGTVTVTVTPPALLSGLADQTDAGTNVPTGTADAQPAALPTAPGLVPVDDHVAIPADDSALGTLDVFRFDGGGTTARPVTPDDFSGAAAIGGNLYLAADAGGVVDFHATPADSDSTLQQALALPYAQALPLADTIFA